MDASSRVARAHADQLAALIGADCDDSMCDRCVELAREVEIIRGQHEAPAADSG